MNGRVPAARDAYQIARDGLGRTLHAIAGIAEALHLDRGDPAAPFGRGDGMADADADARSARGSGQVALRVGAQVDHADADPGALQVERGAIGAVVVGEHDGAAAGPNGIAVDVGTHRARQHDARPVVAGEHQGPLERAGGQHDLARPDLPQALAGQMRVGARRQVIAHALEQAEVVVVVVAEGGGAREHAQLRAGLELRRHPGQPGCARVIERLGQKRAAELGLLVGEDHARAAAAGGERRHEPGRPGADHQHVAVRVHVLVAIGIGLARRPPQPRRAADHALVDASPPALWPHEGLVVKACREKRAEQVVQRPEVEAHRWPAVLTRGAEALVQLDRRGPGVRLGEPAAPQLHERVGLLGAGREDAARAMVLEAAPDQMHAVREQRRGERVAGIAFVADAVVSEAQRAPPVDAAAARPADAAAWSWRRS